MEKEFIKMQSDISSIKTEVGFLNKNLGKLEELLTNVTLLMEKQNVANKRIKDIEDNEREVRARIRKLEDWRLTLVVGAGTIGAIISFIINKILKFF